MTRFSAEMTAAVGAIVLAATVGIARVRHDAADHPTDYVSYERGELPVVLVVPHDGELWRASVPPRSVTPRRDEHTQAIAAEVANVLEARLGGRPHIVHALIDRRQVDVNRPASQAYEHDDARTVYEAFHARLARVTQACGTHGCLVLDLHGNWEYPADLYLGTENGRTVHVRDGSSAEDRLRTAVASADFDVANAASTPATLRGDFITNQLGRPSVTGVEAVMVEVHERVRNDADARNRFAHALAEGIIAHLETGGSE